MLDISQIPSELRPALAIFLKELDVHISSLSTALTDIEKWATNHSVSESRSLAEAQIFEHRFHLIKGGASFFKLDLLRDTAETGEEMFKHGELHSTDPDEVLFKLKRIVRTFDEQAEALRASFGVA